MNLTVLKNKIFCLKKPTLPECSGYIIDLKDFDEDLSVITGYLSKDEKIKSENIKIQKMRHRFLLRKGILRIILGGVLHTEPDQIRYSVREYGKPYIEDSSLADLNFNISHSKEYLFVGVVRKFEIGVDIEKINTSLNYSLIATSILTFEEKHLFSQYSGSDRILAFYKAWVQKEAISKAFGLGISMGFNNYSIRIDPAIKDEEYYIKIEQLNCSVKLRVIIVCDYVYATALISD